MTKDAMRFLALNAVLHGHPILGAFEDNTALMAECLEISDVEAGRLAQKLGELKEDGYPDDPLTGAFLNYFRNHSYTFVAMGTDVVTLSKFMASDLAGQVSNELRYMFLTRMVRDVCHGPQYIIPYIMDGVLYCSYDDFLRVDDAIVEAYQLYMSGPVGTSKGFANDLRKYSSLENYNKLNAKTLQRILKQFVKTNYNPGIYQQTLLNTPDLLTTYKRTGCIMSFTDTTKRAVYWLLDVQGDEELAIVVPAEVSALRNYLLNSVRDLAGVKAVRGPGGAGKILYPGVT